MPSFASRLAALIPSVAMLVALTLLPAPALAQGWGFFGNFFGGPQQPVQQPRVDRRYSYAPYAPRRRAVAPRPRVEPRESDTAAAPKPPSPTASRFVAVFGDSLGRILATGLDDALGDRADVAVLHKARDSTGLVRDDFYDWPKTIAAVLAAQPAPNEKTRVPGREKIDVAVMMIGSNDRQSLTEGGKTYEPGSDDWTRLYTRRVTVIAEAFKKAEIPLVWVGIPITKDDSFADSMAALNDIYRDVAAKAGAVFVDTWEAFSDGDGDFSTFGPDINGQTVRLRSADGVHFTKAGGQKLAHFVDAQIRRALEGHEPAGMSSTDNPDKTKTAPGPVATVPLVKPDAGPVEELTRPALAPTGELEQASMPRIAGRDLALDTALVRGQLGPAPPGRADNASWPAR